jgi:acetyl esterase/lipase
MASQELQMLVQQLRAQPFTEDVTVAELRTRFEMTASMFPLAADVACEPVKGTPVPAEWITAAGAARGRAILYLHGGGYMIGSIPTYREVASRISRAAGAPVLLIDYRLAPEHRFPAALDDATAAYRWLLSTGTEARSAVIAGDSAGGGLTLAALVALRDAGDPLPAAAVCLSPWVDLELTGDSMKTKAADDPMLRQVLLERMAAAYVFDRDRRHPLASPLHADLRGLPPLLVQVGTAEILFDDAIRLAERARKAGVDVTLEPWEELIHLFQLFAAILPEAGQAIDRIGEFVRSTCTDAGLWF